MSLNEELSQEELEEEAGSERPNSSQYWPNSSDYYDLSSLGSQDDETEDDNEPDVFDVSLSEILETFNEMSQDPELTSEVFKKLESKDDSSFLELISQASKSKAYKELLTNPSIISKLSDQLSSVGIIKDLINDQSNRLKDQFLDACESGDLETIKMILPAAVSVNLYEGIRKAIKNKRLKVLEYILDQKATEDSNLFCNVWPSIASLGPEDPIIQLVIRKENKINSGIMDACEAGNVAP
jgi:hypothetical protein